MEKSHSKTGYAINKLIRKRNTIVLLGALSFFPFGSSTGPNMDTFGMQRVPIDSIFKVEFATSGPTDELSQMIIRGKYEGQVHSLMNSVSSWLGLGEIDKADPKMLADKINKVDERKLFSHISSAFHKEFKTPENGETLIDSISTKKFNCYSSAIIIDDALTRMGKRMDVVTVPGHVLLIGKKYAFETTVIEMPINRIIFPKLAVDEPYFPREMLFRVYPIHHEMGPNAFIAGAYAYQGKQLELSNKSDKAIAAYKNVLKIDPNEPRVREEMNKLILNIARK